MRTRFAPSPTGFLHLGHVHAACFAAARGNPFIVRIEDIDPARCRPQFTQAIFEDLAWLGLVWEQPVRHQSQHLDDYQQALNRLKHQGLVYPCFCSRAQIEGEIARSAQAPDLPPRHSSHGPLYPGTCRALSKDERDQRLHLGQAHAWRLDGAKAMERAGMLTWTDQRIGTKVADAALFGDVILARKDTPTSYHLAVVVDDAVQGISLVTRGEDLLESTHLHRLLQALLDLPTPLYCHHPLILGDDGVKLSKRGQAQALRALRAQGYSPQQVKAMAGMA